MSVSDQAVYKYALTTSLMGPAAALIIFKNYNTREFFNVMLTCALCIMQQLTYAASLDSTTKKTTDALSYAAAVGWGTSNIMLMYCYQNRIFWLGLRSKAAKVGIWVLSVVGYVCSIAGCVLWSTTYGILNTPALLALLTTAILLLNLVLSSVEVWSVLALAEYDLSAIAQTYTKNPTKVVHLILVLSVIAIDLYSDSLWITQQFPNFVLASVINTSTIPVKPYLYLMFYSILLKEKKIGGTTGHGGSSQETSVYDAQKNNYSAADQSTDLLRPRAQTQYLGQNIEHSYAQSLNPNMNNFTPNLAPKPSPMLSNLSATTPNMSNVSYNTSHTFASHQSQLLSPSARMSQYQQPYQNPSQSPYFNQPPSVPQNQYQSRF